MDLSRICDINGELKFQQFMRNKMGLIVKRNIAIERIICDKGWMI